MTISVHNVSQMHFLHVLESPYKTFFFLKHMVVPELPLTLSCTMFLRGKKESLLTRRGANQGFHLLLWQRVLLTVVGE